jgi:hypothetical protein
MHNKISRIRRIFFIDQMRRNMRCIRVSRSVSRAVGGPFFMRKSIIEDEKTMSATALKTTFAPSSAQREAAPVVELRTHYKAANSEVLSPDYRFVADIDRENGDTHIIRGYN